MGKKSEFRLDSGKLFRLISKNFRMLVYVTIIAAILSAIVSLFLEKRFKSTATVFPANYDDNKPYFDMKDRKAWFAQLFEIDQYMQIVSSEEIKDYIVNKYNLTVHYDFNPNDPYLQTKVTKAYYSSVEIKRTRFQSVEVIVTDTDPIFAAKIANDIVAMSDTMMNRIIKQKATKMAELYQRQYDNYMKVLDNYADTLNTLGSKKGVTSVEYQAQEYTKAYSTAILNGNTRAANLMEAKLKELGRYSGTYNKEFYLIMNNTVYFGELIRNLVNAKSEIESVIPYEYSFVVDHAKVSDKKSSPKRLLIVFFSAVSAFFLTIMLLIMQEYIGKLLKEKE